MFRLPRTPSALERLGVHVRALPALRSRVPVPLAPPRWVGVLPDGETPFTAEPRLAGTPLPSRQLSSIAASQLRGVVLALADVPAREARQWGVPGDGDVLAHAALRDPALAASVLLADGPRLTGVTGWRLRLVPAGADPLG